MSIEFGQFSRDESTGGFSGDFEFLDLTRGGVISIQGMQIVPISEGDRTGNPDFPHWRVVVAGKAIGAGWNKARRADAAPYISLSIGHPQMNDGRPVTPILIESARKPGVFTMIWDSADPNASSDPAPARAPAAPRDPAAAAPGAGTKRK